ncbi:MAG: class I SAM-dependent methyltransferase [Polyangiaceae bacterium]
MAKSTFDKAYFDRFYESKRTRVYGADRMAHLGAGIVGFLRWFGAPIRNVLDVGAGPGHLRDWFAEHHPKTRYVSTDVSAYACAKYGHVQRDIATWKGRETFDLVVAQGVFPYLSDADVKRGLANVAAMSRGFFYFEAITRKDLAETCDTDVTDTTVHRRTKAAYMAALRPHFDPIGAGLWYRKGGPLGFYELEASP